MARRWRMPSLRDIRRRIRSVRSTAQITRAMQMVAASKMRKAQDATLITRPFRAASVSHPASCSNALRRFHSSVADRARSSQNRSDPDWHRPRPLRLVEHEPLSPCRSVRSGSDGLRCGWKARGPVYCAQPPGTGRRIQHHRCTAIRRSEAHRHLRSRHVSKRRSR